MTDRNWELVKPGIMALTDRPDIQIHYYPKDQSYRLMVCGRERSKHSSLFFAKNTAGIVAEDFDEMGIMND